MPVAINKIGKRRYSIQANEQHHHRHSCTHPNKQGKFVNIYKGAVYMVRRKHYILCISKRYIKGVNYINTYTGSFGVHLSCIYCLL